MADLKDDRKKEEEEYGGFEPDENDDESFMLGEDNDYPAKLPNNFTEKHTPMDEVTASSDTIEDENSDEPTEDESSEIEEESIKDEEITAIPEYVEESDTSNIEGEEEIKDNEEVANNDELDEEFKNKLLADIENSKSKREAEKEEEESFEESETAKQIGDDADTVVMLNDIEVDKPSNSKTVKIEDNEKTIPLAGGIELENDTQTIEENTEKKKKKKTPVWILMLYSSVATFIVTLGIAIIVWSMLVNDNKYIEKSKTSSDKNIAKLKPEEHKENTNIGKVATKDSVSKDEQNWLDSMNSAQNDSTKTLKDNKDLYSSLEDKVPLKENTKKPITRTETPKKVTPKKVVPEKKSEDLADNNTPDKATPKTKTNPPKIDESQFSMPQPTGPVPEKGIFTVQIYSSPSREDAESWLGQLKAKQVPNAMITEQEVKGRTWYRVRYGKFETKDAARASALELGYSQSWIDRVK